MSLQDGCSNITLADTVALSIRADFDALVRKCPNICNREYGPIDTDLLGIGVVISYGIHVSAAIIYAAIMMTEVHIIPSLKRHHPQQPYQPSRFYQLLSRHQDTCLWTSLISTVSICIAASTQILSGSILGAYQGFAILKAVSLSYASLILVCASHHRRMSRHWLFVLGLFVASAFAVTPYFSLAYEKWSLNDYILAACAAWALSSDVSWKNSALRPFSTAGRIAEGTPYFLDLVLLVSWIALRRYRKLHKEAGWSKASRAIVAITAVSCLLTMGLCIYSFVNLLIVRQGMKGALQNSSVVSQWGVGQIAALFAWLPLVMDIIYED